MSSKNHLVNLINKTTIYWITDSNFQTICGEDKQTRFVTDQGKPVTIEEIEPVWQQIFDSFGSQWNQQRQLYRLLYDQIRLFITSFTFLQVYKFSFLRSLSKDEDSFRQFSCNLASMYLFGKKAIDLIKEVEPISGDIYTHFSNTRNLVFEHNYGPNLLRNHIVDPSFFEASGSDSQMRIRIHSVSNEEEYNAFVDYYEDYYQLEKKFIDWLKGRV